MSHRAIRCLIGDAVKSLDDKIQFGFGKWSDFNIERVDKWPNVWLNPIPATTSISDDGSGTILKTWQIWINIIDIDKSGSHQDEWKVILDRMDFLADSLIRRINDWYLTGEDIVGTLTILNVNHRPIIKDTAKIVTGWELRFQIETSDNFDYCKDPDNVAIYNGSYRNNQVTE
jgi:hypothetical protein